MPRHQLFADTNFRKLSSSQQLLLSFQLHATFLLTPRGQGQCRCLPCLRRARLGLSQPIQCTTSVSEVQSTLPRLAWQVHHVPLFLPLCT